MKWVTILQISIIIYIMIYENKAFGQADFFQKNIHKSVPRIGRKSGNSADDFENFFLKATKSVPRIGRRNFDSNNAYYTPDYPEFYVKPKQFLVDKKAGNHFKEVPWAELADMVEYYPEIMLMSPPMWSEGAFRDNYQFEDYGKRKLPDQQTGMNMEVPPEYKKQPIP